MHFVRFPSISKSNLKFNGFRIHRIYFRCLLFYESFNHNTADVNMIWKEDPILILKENITLPDYVLIDYKASSIKRLYPPGIFNELVATFTFQRLYGFYILQVYSLSTLYVLISWVRTIKSAFNFNLFKNTIIKFLDILLAGT